MFLPKKVQQLRARFDLVDDGIANIRPVEARYEDLCVFKREAQNDFSAGLRIGSGGKCDTRHLREALVQDGEFKIFRPKVVPPLRDAVRLVYCKQCNSRACEQIEAARRCQPFGGDVQQIEITVDQRPFDLACRPGIQRRIEKRCAYAELRQCRDLVLHQGDQRRDNNACALPQQCRHLVTQRLAAAGRHQHQRVAPSRNVPDDLRLRISKISMAEYFAQNG